MDWDRIEGNWKTFKGKAQQQRPQCRNHSFLRARLRGKMCNHSIGVLAAIANYLQLNRIG